jgi:hypothetical protein
MSAETKMINGKLCVFRQNAEYPTIRDYYCHSGPGWDVGNRLL